MKILKYSDNEYSPKESLEGGILYVDLEQPEDSLKISSKERPMIVEMSDTEWLIWYPNPREAEKWPERELSWKKEEFSYE